MGVFVEPVTVVPTPVLYGDQRAGKAAFVRRLRHHVLALLRFSPAMGEAEKVERGLLAVWMRPTAARRAEVDEARLGGMKRKPMPSKPLPQLFQDPFGVVLVLEGRHEVIGKSNLGTWPSQFRATDTAYHHG